MLELALRLKLLEAVPGMGRVRADLARDPVGSRRAHTSLLLEVASLALRQGELVAVESKTSGSPNPADILLAGALPVETFVILMDDAMRKNRAYSSQVGNQVIQIGLRHDVWISGKLAECLDAAETSTWLAVLEETAAQVEADGIERAVDHEAGSVRVTSLSRSHTASAPFSGPDEVGRGWPRVASKLRDKAVQAQASGATWLRVDLMDGLWQFSPWGQSALPDKTEAIADWTRQALASAVGLNGVVVTCGSALAEGQFVADFYSGEAGVLGMRRIIDVWRVREAIIIPLAPRSLQDAGRWLALYDDEGLWLDWALERVGLPPAKDVTCFQPINPPIG
ncbi:MAG TPA: hypothetical protein VKY26_04760 [Actinomycetota bacterium]|nr:hypothetical protein [Actinomycetota bacterium]